MQNCLDMLQRSYLQVISNHLFIFCCYFSVVSTVQTFYHPCTHKG